MAEMPTIYPMRMPSIQAPRQQTNIDELLPSTYMDRPGLFAGAMQNVGAMLGKKRDDATEADRLALTYGANIQPGQSGSLMDAMARLGRPDAYGGAANPATGEVIQLPGQAPATDLNTMGQGAMLTAYEKEQVRLQKEKAQNDANILATQKLNDAKQRAADQLAQRKIEGENRAKYWKDATTARMYAAARGGSNQEVKKLGMIADQRAKALKAAEDQNKADFALYENLVKQANDPTVQRPHEQDAQLLQNINAVHDRMQRNDQIMESLRRDHQDAIKALTGAIPGGSAPVPVAPPAAPTGRPTRPNGSRWFDKSELAAHPEAAAKIPAGKTGGWFTPASELDTY